MAGERAFVNGTVYVGGGTLIERGYVLTEGPVIREVGPTGNLDRRPGLEIVDIGGGLITAGLTDCHLHLVGFAHALLRVDLSDTASPEEGLRRVATSLERLPRGSWLRGRGWDKQRWGMARFPTREMLDSVAPDNPVALWSRDGHNMWVNSLALSLIGVSDGLRSVEGGEIEVDEHGRPTGMLLENAVALVPKKAGEEDPATVLRAVRDACDRLIALGITAVHSVQSKHHGVILDAAVEAGHVPLRMFRMQEVDGPEDLDDPELLRVCQCVKLYADGALGSQTASMLEPYCGQPDNVGITVTSRERIYDVVSRSAEMGLASAVHAIGDRANMEVLNVYERVRREQPDNEAIMRIEHAQVLRRDDIPRFASLGVIASMQPIHVVSDMDVAVTFWGPRARNAYLWKTIQEGGARVAFGSDAPIEGPDPLKGIHAAVTRRRPGTPDSAAWNSDECLSVAEAIDCYTTGAAAASGSLVSGRLEPGFRADLTVLDHNILAADRPDAILDTGAAMTVIGGEIHYEA